MTVDGGIVGTPVIAHIQAYSPSLRLTGVAVSVLAVRPASSIAMWKSLARSL